MNIIKLLSLLMLPHVQLTEFISATCTANPKMNVNYNEFRDYSERTEEFSSVDYTCHNISLPITEIHIATKDKCFINCNTNFRIMSLVTKTIPPLAFTFLSDINVLHMENLQIVDVSPEAFKSLDVLNELYLSKNAITDISDIIFYPLKKLKVLDLSANNIKHVTQHFLAGTIHIQLLNLSYNNLETFDGSFIHSISPISIDLSFNLISSLRLNNSLSFIESLNVSNNLVSEVNGCWNNYKNLYFRQNKLKSALSLNCNSSNSSLKYLDLGLNRILKVSYNFTRPEISLEILLFDNNYISSIPPGFSVQFPLLNSLNLSFNYLSKLEYGAFDHFEHLQNLDLSHNRLTSIRRYIHNLRSLNTLHLNDNTLSYLNAAELSQDLPLLQEIYLDNNIFSCVDLIQFIQNVNGRIKIVDCGKSRTTTNIKGIACVETNKELNVIEKFGNLLSHKLGSFFKNDSSFTDYLDTDFKNSNFYKYLEGLQHQKTLKLNETELISYFNKDFKNSTFYKYLEGLRDEKAPATSFNDTFIHYFNHDFRNSSFVKYLENLKNADYVFNGGFNKSILYNFFNDNFRNSDFFKYMENFKNLQNNVYLKNNYSILETEILEVDRLKIDYLIVITCFLFIIAFGVCFLVSFLWRYQYILHTHHSHVNENIVLHDS